MVIAMGDGNPTDAPRCRTCGYRCWACEGTPKHKRNVLRRLREENVELQTKLQELKAAIGDALDGLTGYDTCPHCDARSRDTEVHTDDCSVTILRSALGDPFPRAMQQQKPADDALEDAMDDVFGNTGGVSSSWQRGLEPWETSGAAVRKTADMSGIFDIIDDELEYQASISNTDGVPKRVGEYLTLLRYGLSCAEMRWSTCAGSELALHELRKLGAILLKCLDEHGVPKRT